MRRADGELILFWTLPALAIIWVSAFFLFPGFNHPMSPTMSAEEVAGFYRDETARILILMASHGGDDAAFAARVDRLCTTAEVTEYIAYLKGFAIFPAAALLYGRAREGVRSAITPVFAAIACHNPYPFDHFDADAWNQMVVKAVFSGTPIETIFGLHERRNPEVVQMLRDLVSERRAAGRPLPDAVHAYVAAN